MAEEWSDEEVQNFVDAMVDDFLEHGVDAIVTVREDNPELYFQVIAELLCVFHERQPTRQPLIN